MADHALEGGGEGLSVDGATSAAGPDQLLVVLGTRRCLEQEVAPGDDAGEEDEPVVEEGGCAEAKDVGAAGAGPVVQMLRVACEEAEGAGVDVDRPRGGCGVGVLVDSRLGEAGRKSAEEVDLARGVS